MSEIRLKTYRSPTEFRTETYRQPRVTIGREINNDVVIPEKDVSRFHSLFECGEDGWKIVDLESTNGTYLNGICVKKAPIKSGDVIVIGSTRFHVLECPAAAPFVPVSIGGYRLIRKFDARGVLRAAGGESGTPEPDNMDRADRPDTRPTRGPGVPKPLAPVLGANEIIAGADDPVSIARVLLGRLRPLVECDACVASICDPETDEIKWTVEEPGDETLSVPNELAGFVRRKRVAALVQIEHETGAGDPAPRAAICAPILDGRRFLGTLSVLRRDGQWKLGDPDIELAAIAGLAAGSALGCAFHYSRIERAYLDLLETTESLPATVGDLQQSEADGILIDASVQQLRIEVERLVESARSLYTVMQRGEAAHDPVAEIQAAGDRVGEIVDSLSRISRQGRDARGEAKPAELLSDMMPLLRGLVGRGTTINDRVASELPAVAVAPRVLRAALVRILQFCRDRMHAVRITLTAELHGFEEPLAIQGHDPIAPGHFVWVVIESEGDVTAMEDLAGFGGDDPAAAHDPRSRAMGLYWAARMLRRAAGRLIIRGEGDRAIGFDLYLPVIE